MYSDSNINSGTFYHDNFTMTLLTLTGSLWMVNATYYIIICGVLTFHVLFNNEGSKTSSAEDDTSPQPGTFLKVTCNSLLFWLNDFGTAVQRKEEVCSGANVPWCYFAVSENNSATDQEKPSLKSVVLIQMLF